MSASIRPEPDRHQAAGAADARQKADLVAERVLDAGREDLEAVFLMGAIGQPSDGLPASLLLSTPNGSVCFVEDAANTIWLTRRNVGCASGTALRLSADDDVDAIAEICFEALSGEGTLRRVYKPLN